MYFTINVVLYFVYKYSFYIIFVLEKVFSYLYL